MDPLPWVLLAKPVLYWGVFSVARTWSDHPHRISRWWPPLGAIARLILGFAGIPLALLCMNLGETGLTAVFTAFRFLLWLLVLRIFIPNLKLGRNVMLAFAATGLNWAIDLLIFGGLWTDFGFLPRC